MAHKKRHTAPIPKGNRPRAGGGAEPLPIQKPLREVARPGVGFAEQDPKKRLGDHGGAGEHPFVQPGGKNDANR